MKYKCIVFDHDDTVVRSTETIHYPAFTEFAKIYRPNISISFEEFLKYNFEPGVVSFFKDYCKLTNEEMKIEEEFWKKYVNEKIPLAFDGIKEIMEELRKQGIIIAVISHSLKCNILRDYKYNNLPKPDVIFGWEEPAELRKPSPYSLFKIMKDYNLKSSEILVLDDLKPGHDMARAANTVFAAPGWAYDVKEIESFMKTNADFYFKTVSEFKKFLDF